MESKFIPTLQVGNGYTHLKLRGVLDEDNLLMTLLSQIQGRLLLIDLAELNRINSCGVRDWVNWLNQIQALGLQVILLRCSPSVVAQANMVTNFAADAFIHSFYAPYVHPDTGEEQSVLLFTESLRKSRPIQAPKIFAEDGSELEFDEFEDSYFAFVNDPRMLNYTIPADIQAVVQYFVPESASQQPVIQAKNAAPAATPAPIPAAPMGKPMAGPASMSALSAVASPYGGMRGNAPQTGVAPGNFNAGPKPANAFGSPQPFAANRVGAPVSQGYNSPAQKAAPAPATQSLGPQPSSPIIRHEQPPIPSTSGYQQPPMAKPAPAPAPAQKPPAHLVPNAALSATTPGPLAKNEEIDAVHPAQPAAQPDAQPAPFQIQAKPQKKFNTVLVIVVVALILTAVALLIFLISKLV